MNATALCGNVLPALRSSTSSLLALALLFSAVLTAGAAQQQTLYAASGTFGVTGILYTLDPATGAVLTTVGPLNDAAGNNYAMAGMKYDYARGLLYGATSGKSATGPSYLIIIDPATALVTPIGPFDEVITDIAIDPTSGVMYGVSGFNQKFFTINTQTGLATQTGSTGIGFQNGGGFAANSRGVLYGVSNFSFYTYNKTTGAATFIGGTLLPNFIRAADFDANDVFYGLEGGGGIDNVHLRFLVTFDLITGLGRLVGSISTIDLDGLAFVPVPTIPIQLTGIVSEMTHAGVPYDIDLASGSGVECRNSPAGTYTVILTFLENLTSVASASAACGTVGSSTIGPGPNQYTINLTGAATCNAQRNTVTLTDVTDVTGNHSDTLLSPPWGLLIGDTTGDGSVNSADISQTKAQSGNAVTASNFRQDVTADGSLNSSDIGLVKSKSGTGLP